MIEAAAAESKSKAEGSPSKVRCIIQQCMSAKLQTQIADLSANVPAEFVQVF